MKVSGAKIVVDTLIEQGVDNLFGYPGGAILDIYDELYKSQDKIRHILSVDERGAIHSADGYARATGRVGVVLATSGPGATNLVTGIATANLDSVPIVAITGNVKSELIGSDSFQEVDIAGIVMPITKYSFFVKDIEKLYDTLRDAFRIAMSGRPGVVLVDITKDVLSNFVDIEYKGVVQKDENPKIDYKGISRLIEDIESSVRPIVVYGGGVNNSNAGDKLLKFCQNFDIPFCNTMMGIGQISMDNELNLGLCGMNGKYSSNKAISKADFIIAIGTRFSDRVATDNTIFSQDAKIVHIDIDSSEIDKNVYSQYGIVGDIGEVLDIVNNKTPKKIFHKEWLKQIKAYRQKDILPINCSNYITPYHIVNTINDKLQGGIIVTDVGQHQVWTAQYSKKLTNRSFISSGGLGTMGFGVGASIGACFACPNKRVVLCTGDGSFYMNALELITAVKHNLNLVVVIFNNKSLGMVRQMQEVMYDKRYYMTDLVAKTDYVMLARAIGANGEEINTIDEFNVALDRAFDRGGVYILDCKISIDEKVIPTQINRSNDK